MNERIEPSRRRSVVPSTRPSTSASNSSSSVGASLVRRAHARTKRAVCVYAEARVREQCCGAQGSRVCRFRARGARKSGRVVLGTVRGWDRCDCVRF